MSKMKPLLAIGIILLFVGLSFSPATAKVIDVKEKLELGMIGEDGKISMQTFKLSADELKETDRLLAQLMEKMQSATDYDQLIDTVKSFRTEWGRFPFLMFLLGLIEKILNMNHNLNQLRPLRKNALIMSWGFGPRFNPFKQNKVTLFLPIMTWYYTGRGNLLINSRTIIVDPYPFSIKSLTGREFGCMRNFGGLYIYRHSTLTDKTYTFMLGRAAAVRGFDLSLFNVWNQ